ncbi:uncharacterized protein VTP21DRAFT_895 [Calcarisporiella thermophila]|uniref:uncharacterized protein n=1 Tax=Calcarisporiella thermophila TaxID=911321 RepID=UPI003743D74E
MDDQEYAQWEASLPTKLNIIIPPNVYCCTCLRRPEERTVRCWISSELARHPRMLQVQCQDRQCHRIPIRVQASISDVLRPKTRWKIASHINSILGRSAIPCHNHVDQPQASTSSSNHATSTSPLLGTSPTSPQDLPQIESSSKLHATHLDAPQETTALTPVVGPSNSAARQTAQLQTPPPSSPVLVSIVLTNTSSESGPSENSPQNSQRYHTPPPPPTPTKSPRIKADLSPTRRRLETGLRALSMGEGFETLEGERREGMGDLSLKRKRKRTPEGGLLGEACPEDLFEINFEVARGEGSRSQVGESKRLGEQEEKSSISAGKRPRQSTEVDEPPTSSPFSSPLSSPPRPMSFWVDKFRISQ